MSKPQPVPTPEERAARLAAIEAILPTITDADLLPNEVEEQREIAMMRDAAANLTNLANAKSHNIMLRAVVRRLAGEKLDADAAAKAATANA